MDRSKLNSVAQYENPHGIDFHYNTRYRKTYAFVGFSAAC